MFRFKLTTLTTALLPIFTYANTATENLEQVDVVASQGYTQGYGAYGTSTATGMPMALRETPQNVSILSEKQIKDQQLNTLGKALSRAVGLHLDLKGSSTSGYSVLYARGNTVRNFQLDGLPSSAIGLGGKGPGDMPNAWPSLNTAQYERIEILRGATALMDGSGEPSATVSLHRKRPTKAFQGEFSSRIGRFNSYGSTLDLSSGLNSDNSVRGRLVANYDASDTFRERAKNRNAMVYAITEWDITPNTMLSFGATYQYMKDLNSSMFGLVLYDTEGNAIPASRTSNATANGSYVNFNSLNLFTELKHRWNEQWETTVEYGFTRSHRDQVAGIAGSAFANPTVPMVAGAIVKSDETPKQHNFTASLIGQYNLWGREHDAMFGISGYDLNGDQPRYTRQILRLFRHPTEMGNFNGDVSLPTWTVAGEDKNRVRQIGGYVATRLRPTDKLAIILGGRYTRFNITEDTQYIIKGQNSQSSFTPYTGLIYDLSEGISAYTSYAKIFSPQTKRDINNHYLKSEEGSNLEAGLKGEFLEGRLNAALAFFETRKSNVGFCAQYSLGGLLCDYYDFDPKTKTRGWELEVNGSLTPNWHINAGFSQSKTKNQDGKHIQGEIPVNQFKLFTSYQWQQLTLGAGVRWQSKIVEDTPWGLNPGASEQVVAKAKSVSKQKAFAIVDLMARYQINKNIDLTINVENLFDKTYRTSVNSHSYGSPRQIIGSLTVKF